MLLIYTASCDLLWQAPDVPKAKMFKVLKEVVEEKSQGSKGTSGVPKLNYVFFFPRGGANVRTTLQLHAVYYYLR